MRNFDDLFREASENYSETPPPAVWTALEKRLDNKKRRVFPLRWFWYFSIVSFLTLLGASIAWKTTRIAPTGDIASLNTAKKELSANDNIATTANNNITNTTTNSTSTSNTNNNETAHEKTTQHTPDNTHPAAISSISATNNTATKTHRHKKAALKETYAAKTTKENNDVAENGTGNAPTVGTSAYSYDDFEENTPLQASIEPATGAPTASLGSGYVAKKTKKNRLVAVDMVPVTTQGNDAATVKENNSSYEHPASVASSETTNPNENPINGKQKEKNENAAIAHTSDTHKSVAVRKKKTTAVSVVSALPTSVSTTVAASKAVKTPATKTVKHVATPKEDRKDVSQPAVAAINKSSKKEAKHTAATTNKTENATTVSASKTVTKVTKAATAHPSTQNAQPAAIQPTATAIPVEHTTNTVASATTTGIKANHTEEKAIATTEKKKGPKEKIVASASTPKKQKKNTNSAQVVADTKIDAIGEPAITANKKITSYTTKKANKKTAPSTHNEYAATAKQDDGVNGENPTLPTPGNKKAKSLKQPAKATQPVASSKGTTSKPAPTAEPQPVVAPKPAVSKTPAPAQKVAAKKSSSSVANEPETEEATTEPVIASAPPAAKAEEKKTEAKIVVPKVKKAEEPTIEKAATTDSTKDNEPDALRRFMAGIKGGYESGMSKVTANKFVISPYFQYKIGGKVSLLVQPSLKASHLNKRSIGSAASYYDVHTGTGNYSLHDSELLVIPITATTFDTYWKRNYTYTETHDSISKSYSIGGTYFEIELPLLLQYHITPKLSVYGGINTVYSKLISVKENSFIARELVTTGNPSTVARVGAPAPTPTETGITYTGNPYSGYSGPLYPEQTGSSFRFGYMLGFSYEIRKRWMADVLVQQTSIKQNWQAGYNINNALSMPYVRFTIGYRLTK